MPKESNLPILQKSGPDLQGGVRSSQVKSFGHKSTVFVFFVLNRAINVDFAVFVWVLRPT